jgi:hypothetical protein
MSGFEIRDLIGAASSASGSQTFVPAARAEAGSREAGRQPSTRV